MGNNEMELYCRQISNHRIVYVTVITCKSFIKYKHRVELKRPGRVKMCWGM